MTPAWRNDDRMDRDTFETELQRLVARAHDDGVELGGGYNARSPHPDVPDYTIEITEQEKLVSDGGTDTASALIDSDSLLGGQTIGEVQRRAIGRFLFEPF